MNTRIVAWEKKKKLHLPHGSKFLSLLTVDSEGFLKENVIYIPNPKHSVSPQMQASSLILVKHSDYFMWISSNQVLGVLKLMDADVKRNRQTEFVTAKYWRN